MASSGKKGKKNKGTVISLQSFLANGDTPAGTTQVAKKLRNVDGDDSDEGNALPSVYQLPTAPRANRIFDDEAMPHKPPYIAYVTNLPFDANEDDIYAFFGNTNIVSLRLPREDGETGRVRGFGYVEFENRDDLINVLSLPDPTIKGRRIRIELSNENEQHNNRQRMNRRGFDGFGSSNEGRDRESTNWRQDSAGFGHSYDKGFNRERKTFHEDVGEPGSWRTGNRPQASDFSSSRRERSNDRNREYGTRNRHMDRNEREQRDRDRGHTDEPVQERPKLNLKPRTLPLPEIVTKPEEEEIPKPSIADEDKEVAPKVKMSGVSSEKVFGSAKPVDTATRELEIEERLEEARRQERIKREKEQVEVSAQMSEIHLEKTDKENANSAISWRRKNVEGNKDVDSRKHSPDRKPNTRDKDPNQHRNRDKTERADNARVKRDTKMERAPPKHQPLQSEPVLQSSNKYFGLDDEASE